VNGVKLPHFLIWCFRRSRGPAPAYRPFEGSYGEDYADIDGMVLCSKVLGLAALEMCG